MSNQRLVHKVTQFTAGDIEGTYILGADGNVISFNPAEAFAIAKVDDDGDETSVHYYGYLRADGAWYIMQESKSGNETTYQYYTGASDFSTGWTNRATLGYSTFDAIF